MKRAPLWLLSIVLLLAACASKPAAAPTPPPLPTATPFVPSLRALAQQKHLFMGSAISARLLRDDPVYGEVLGREFDSVTTENAMKFATIHPEPQTFSFGDADAIVRFAHDHNMRVTGHTLVWHKQVPDWIEQGRFSPAKLKAILHDHITTVVSRYRGQVKVWDVVNEAIDDDGSLRKTIWLKTLGPDYIKWAFQWAHDADPQALLRYNDYNGEGSGRKSDAIYQLVRDLRAQHVPIQAVGLQMHLRFDAPPPREEMAANMRRLADLGLEVHITEMDVRLADPVSDAELRRQADVYQDMLSLCLALRSCTTFVTWGFVDKASWIPEQFPGWGNALLFDANYQPKPAYRRLYHVLSLSARR